VYVVIIGAGEVGSYVARILVEDGHDVAIIEVHEGRARHLDGSLDALVVQGSGASPAALQRAGIERADLLLAVTAIDEVNLIACMTGRKYRPAGLRTVARVRQSRQVAGEVALSAEDLGLDGLVSPEQAVAAATMDALQYPGSGEMRELANGKLVLVGMGLSADSPLVHETLAGLRRDFPPEFLVVAVQGRDGIRIPTGADRLAVDERAFVLTLPKNLTELAILSGEPWHRVQRILIVGCGNTGLALARELEREGFAPTIVEHDHARAELVAGLLPRALVLHADGSDPEFLRTRIEEERIDAAVVLLEEAEKSVLIGVFAKSLGARKVVVRCDESGYAQLAVKLGVDAVLTPKRVMAEAILRYLRKGAIDSTLLLGNHEAEVIHFRVPAVPARTALVKKPLKALGFPKGALVGAVIRGGVAFIGSGETVLQPGDELLVVCQPQALDRVGKLLA